MSNVMSGTCSPEFECNGMFEICFHGLCMCRDTYFSFNGICVPCPGLGKPCDDSFCCADSSMECLRGVCTCRNGIENSLTCSISSPQTPIYITASQIALSAALIMGMAALTMVIYRLCTKPRYLSARQRALASRAGLNADSESLSYANYLRASLTSMQIRVLTRLRDRPPSYDTRQTPTILPEAPPPYEGAAEVVSLPPAYSELAVSSTGYVNSTFIDSEPGSVSRSTASNSPTNRTLSNSSVSRNCDINQSADDTRDKDKVSEDTVDEKTEASDGNRIPI